MRRYTDLVFKGDQFPFPVSRECFLAMGLLSEFTSKKPSTCRWSKTRARLLSKVTLGQKARDFIDMAHSTQTDGKIFSPALGIWAVRDNILAELSTSITSGVASAFTADICCLQACWECNLSAVVFLLPLFNFVNL